MRTYEIELTMQVKVKSTITSEKEETHATLTEAAVVLGGFEAHNLVNSNVKDITPAPLTDKQRVTLAFRELRKLGYKAKQNLSPYDTGVDVYTTREDADWAFTGNKLTGALCINWDYGESSKKAFHEKRVQRIKSLFEQQGFATEWGGEYYQGILIRGGNYHG